MENAANNLQTSEIFFKHGERGSTIKPKSGHILVGFKRLDDGASIPAKAHESDSGFDLVANKDVIIRPGETAVVPTGISVHLPPGYEAQVRPRSGVTSKTKLRVQIGTIDNGYAGEVGVIVDNFHMKRYSEILYGLDGKAIHEKGIEYPEVSGSYLVRKGDRIAQLVVQELPKVEPIEFHSVVETDRGDGGYGSTGINGDTWLPGGGLVEVDCETCKGIEFSKHGICDECGGRGVFPG